MEYSVLYQKSVEVLSMENLLIDVSIGLYMAV